MGGKFLIEKQKICVYKKFNLESRSSKKCFNLLYFEKKHKIKRNQLIFFLNLKIDIKGM